MLLEISAQFWFLFAYYILLWVDQQICLSNVHKLSPISSPYFMTNPQTKKAAIIISLPSSRHNFVFPQYLQALCYGVQNSLLSGFKSNSHNTAALNRSPLSEQICCHASMPCFSSLCPRNA